MFCADEDRTDSMLCSNFHHALELYNDVACKIKMRAVTDKGVTVYGGARNEELLSKHFI